MQIPLSGGEFAARKMATKKWPATIHYYSISIKLDARAEICHKSIMLFAINRQLKMIYTEGE